MADTDWGGFTDVAYALSTDVALVVRGAGGVNMTVAGLRTIATDEAIFGRTAGGVATRLLVPHSSGVLYFGSIDAGFDTVTCRAGGADVVTIKNSGFVGFGTTLPAARIHVADTDQSVARIILQNTGASGRSYHLVAGVHGVTNEGLSILDATAGATRIRLEADGTFRPGAEIQSLGNAGIRWAQLYAVTNVISTSDAREKHWLGELTDSHLRAAKRIAAEIGIYQWLAELEAKGDAARVHVGVRAQRVWQIMHEEKLEEVGPEGKTARHAFLCYDEWEAEREAGKDGQPKKRGKILRPAGNRYGLRVDQLALFLIAAQEARLAKLEAAAV